MTNNTNNTQKNDNSSFQNIKKLNGIIQSGEMISGLLTDIKALRKRIESLSAAHQQKVLQKAEREAAKKEIESPAPPPPPEKKTAKIIADSEVAEVTPKPLVKTSASHLSTDGASAATASAVGNIAGGNNANKSQDTSQAPRSVSGVSGAANAGGTTGTVSRKSEPAKKSETLSPAAKTSATISTTTTGAATKTYTPSYIRGEVIPPPPRPVTSKPIRPSYPPRTGGGYPPRTGSASGAAGSGIGGTMGTRRPPYIPTGAGQAGGQRPYQKPLSKTVATVPPPTVTRKFDAKKKDHPKSDERKTLNKRTLIRKGFITENTDEERMGSRKLKSKKQKASAYIVPRIEKALITTENLTVKILSEKIGKTAQEIIKQLMVLGIMTNINSVVDFPTMELVASELGVELELKLEQTKESQLEIMHDEADDEIDLVKRPPIVTVMGHVDHGKTSLLDAIRKTNVVSGEAGGITQHIGAYSVQCRGEKITFLDTPGHEAFTELRKRGANVTDIAILIVAADDRVMPQTIEAINHARAAKVPILVAMNKIDKPQSDIEKLKQELAAYDLVPEEWGGDTVMVPISAKRGDGIDKLLEMVLFLAEYHNFRANPERNAKASIIEAKLDKGKGPVANIIVQNGTMRVGDFVVSGMTCGRIRAMVDDKGRNIKEALPSTPVSILGFADIPEAGDGVFVVDDEKMAKQIIEERNVKKSIAQTNLPQKRSLEDLIDKINAGLLKELSLIIKGDVQGSIEALKLSLSRLSTEEVRVNILHSGVGAINKSDIMLAEVSSSKAIIIGFNVRPDAESKTMAEKSGIEIKLYDIIYEAINDIERLVKGMIAPKYRYNTIGRAQVRNVFKITGAGMVAGSYVLNGKMVRGAKAKIYRGSEVVYEGTIDGLKRFKDDVKEVAFGFECGITISGYSDIKENDEIEAIIEEEIKA